MACRICQHASRPEIDSALVLGVPIRRLCTEYGLRRSSLGRHKLKHVPQAAKQAFEKITLAYSARLRTFMNRAQEQTLQILADARRAGNNELALEAVKTVRENTKVMRSLTRATDARTTRGKAVAQTPEVEVVYEEVPPRVA